MGFCLKAALRKVQKHRHRERERERERERKVKRRNRSLLFFSLASRSCYHSRSVLRQIQVPVWPAALRCWIQLPPRLEFFAYRPDPHDSPRWLDGYLGSCGGFLRGCPFGVQVCHCRGPGLGDAQLGSLSVGAEVDRGLAGRRKKASSMYMMYVGQWQH